MFEEKFNKQLFIGFNEKTNTAVASLMSSTPEFASERLNEFVDFIAEKTVSLLKNESIKRITQRKEELDQEIASLRKLTKKKREDAIVILSEAYDIAKKLNINEVSLFSIPDDLGSTGMGMSGENSPPYIRGTNALLLEIEALRTRKNDDPYIENLRELEEKINNYNLYIDQINSDEYIKAALVDQYAVIPEIPIKPKRIQIVAFGIIAGLILGVFVVLILNFIRSVREQFDKAV